MTYEEAYEIVQNQEWENEDDFGDELLDLIRRHKRVSTLPNSFFLHKENRYDPDTANYYRGLREYDFIPAYRIQNH